MELHDISLRECPGGCPCCTPAARIYRGMRIVSVWLFLFLCAIPLTSSAASMKDYCIVPPHIANAGVMPNIMIAFENGEDMLNRAYPADELPGDPGANFDKSRRHYGFFDSGPDDRYAYDSTGGYFIKNNACEGKNCFAGDLLNWAVMSLFDISRKALVGFGWPEPGTDSGAGNVFTYNGILYSLGQAHAATVSGRDPLSGIEYTFCLSGSDGSNPTGIQISLGNLAHCNAGVVLVDGKVRIRYTSEDRTGFLQQFADKDQNYQYDMNAPRFGIRRWNSGKDTQQDIPRDSPPMTASETEQYFRNLLTAASAWPPADPQTPYLADMMREMAHYFTGSASSYSDNDGYSQTPYAWADDPARACRKTFAVFVTTGRHPGPDSSRLLPLPAACASLRYPDAFPSNACYAYHRDLYPDDGIRPRQNVSTYIIHTAYYGSSADNEKMLAYAAAVSDGEYFRVNQPEKLGEALSAALNDILKRMASGTASSMLSSGEGSGANMLQALFYPRTPISPTGMFDRRVSWIGRLQNLWYHVDPFFVKSSIREDSNGDRILDLSNDYIAQTYYDPSEDATKTALYADLDGNGVADSAAPLKTKHLETLTSLWEGGLELWKRDLAVSPRVIYIPASVTGAGTHTNLSLFSTGNASSLRPYLDLPEYDSDRDGFRDGDLNHDGIVNDNDARVLIQYIQGEDFSSANPSCTWLRPRTVGVDLNGDGDSDDTGESPKVWRLGDIVNSTPRVASWIPLNSYHTAYGDTTYGMQNMMPHPEETADPDHFVTSAQYRNRGMVFAGANDGMLHAFKLGKLEFSGAWKNSETKKARLRNPDPSTPLGHEMWAFIPGNVLPYLKYLADPGYCHIYTVDLSPYLFDASINGSPGGKKTADSWRTVLIGGMRFGGACRDADSQCNSPSGGSSDCVKSPVRGNGLSSYFALDITDQTHPRLLWEFTDPGLGFTTTGPAVVRIGEDRDKNGEWYVVFGSGPTGPISTTDQQFLGNSDQNLSIFVVNLRDGSMAVPAIDTGIPKAFAGSMMNAAHDSNMDYQDDVLYVPYTKKAADNTWTDGGILRILTNGTVPSGWSLSTLIDFTGGEGGPVTSSVTRLQNRKKGNLWLYFGTGRYFFSQASAADDQTKQRRIFGIKDPCFSIAGFASGCTSGMRGLNDVTNTPNLKDEPENGWFINLDPAGSFTYPEGIPSASVTKKYRAERVITDPVSTGSGLVFFTSFKPYGDVCSLGGKSFVWAVKYDTGGYAGALLRGKALLQTSTGSIEQKDLGTAFSPSDMSGGRKSSAIEGAPPTAQGLSVIAPPPPVKRVLHMREK